MDHTTSLLTSKKVLAVCMETTAGGRNYSGGLGALFGDTVRTMYRLGASFIAFTPIYKYGYVKQSVNEDTVIDEYPAQDFNVDYEDTGIILDIPMCGRTIKVKVWRNKLIDTAFGLDSYLPENGEFANITNNLYGENGFGSYNGEDQRLMQEVIVGVGSIMAAHKLGFDFEILHLNEGHGIFAALYLISQYKEEGYSFNEALAMVRRQTVFTTHTPIGAGNKSRDILMILGLGVNLGLSYEELQAIGKVPGNDHMFGSTTAALRVSKVANAVALRHQSTSQELWKKVDNRCPITYIDNGVDIKYWQSITVKEAYEKNSPAALLAAHGAEKKHLIDEVEKRTGIRLKLDKPIFGFARRVIEYKRADLIFEDIPRFERLLAKGFQIIFSGKTHPKDHASKRILMKLYEMTRKYPNNVVFLQNYDVEIAGIMTKGCDAWIAYPEIPHEACSTSGMKAAANGVLNISTADGWWFRSCRYAVNGWTIGESVSHDKYTDAQFLYDLLEEKVLPAYESPIHWAKMMAASIYTANEECSTDRMVRDYYAYIYNAPYLY